MRAIASAETDAYSSLAGAAAALYGPLHGGANEAVLAMLSRIGSAVTRPGVHRAREGEGGVLFGFGHRVYKNYDPRATVIKGVVDEVLDVRVPRPSPCGGKELERIALEDDYFVSRRLYPNVDFYSGHRVSARSASTRPPSPFCSRVARTVGWVCHYDELMSGEFKIRTRADLRRRRRTRGVPNGAERCRPVRSQDCRCNAGLLPAVRPRVDRARPRARRRLRDGARAQDPHVRRGAARDHRTRARSAVSAARARRPPG